MKNFWLALLLLISAPAFADIDQEPGQTAKTTQPYPVRYPQDKIPFASMAIGPNALTKQTVGATTYENFAIGLGALNGALTSAGIQNFAIGYNACHAVTSGAQNTCIGVNTGSAITSGAGNLLIGTNAGSGLTSGSYNIIMDAATAAGSGCTSCSTSVLVGSGTGAINGVNSTIIGYNAGLHDTSGGNYQTIIGANVGLNTLGSSGAQSNIVLIGGNTTSGVILDVPTTSTTTAIGIGTGYPGTGDTMVGYAALGSNTFDSAFQAAFGWHSLTLSNVAAAQNSAFGAFSCAAVTTGKNNVCFGYNAGGTTLATGSNNILIGSGADTVASSTAGEINIGGLLFYNAASTAAPAISACGTGSPTIDANANNKSGTVTAGTVATTCTITFAGAGYASWNHCRVTGQGTAISYSYTKSAITVTAGALGGVLIDYDCDGV